MPNILYIGDPTSIHDVKWMSAFSNKKGVKAYLAAQDFEVEKMTDLDSTRLSNNNITLISGLKFYSLWKQWHNWQSAKIIRKVVNEYNIDLIHVLFITPFALYANYTNTPAILTSRGSDTLLVLPSLFKSKGLRKIHDQLLFGLFKKVICRAKAITCTSIAQQKSLNNLFGGSLKTELIRTGVDVNTIANIDVNLSPIKKSRGKKMVLFPRYIQPIYNTLFQVDALRLMEVSEREKCQLVFIVGRNPDKEYLKQVKVELSSLNVEYQFVEYLGQEELWALYRTSDITIMTPTSDGTPNSGLEAMSANSLLIVGNLPYDEDLFNTNSCVKMSSDNPQELADLIVGAIKKPNSRLLDSAFKIVSEKGNRSTEMARLGAIYKSSLSTNLS